VVESGGETRNDGGDESEVHVIFYFIGDWNEKNGMEVSRTQDRKCEFASKTKNGYVLKNLTN
jgi:hypothetical protein